MISIYSALIDNEEDKRLFEQLYTKYKTIMYNTAYAILHYVQRSEDAVHDAFLSVARNMNKISAEECIRTRNFLIIIVRNAALNIYNKNKSEIPVEEMPTDIPDLQAIDIDVENKDNQKKMLKLIKSLDPQYGDVLILKYFYDYQNKEIAKILKICLENVKIRLFRGKAMLKEKYLETNYDR